MEAAMPTLTLEERPSLSGDDFFQPSNPQKGDPWLVIERVLVDASGITVGSLTVRGTFMKVDPPSDPLIAANATHRITGLPGRQGDICVQGVFRYSDEPKIIAIVGGTDHFRNARGTLTIHFAAGTRTLVFDYLG
jgi:hypothetical protein